MNNLKNSVLELLRAEQTKNEKREFFNKARSSDDDYFDKRQSFRDADDAFELAAEAVIKLVQELMAADELSDEIDALGEFALPFGRFADSRGLRNLLEENTSGVAQLAKRWNKAAAKFTALRQLNQFRAGFTAEGFEEFLEGDGPVNVDAAAWTNAVEAFNTRLEALNEQTDYSLEPTEAMADVAFDLEREARRAYDKLTEQFVEVLRDLQESGRLSGELEELDHTLLPIVRDALTRVPQLQRQVQTQPQTHAVTVL